MALAREGTHGHVHTHARVHTHQPHHQKHRRQREMRFWFNVETSEGHVLTSSHEHREPTTMLLTAKSLQSCPTLCDPIEGSPPGSPVPGILQARTLEWVAISFSKGGVNHPIKYKRCQNGLLYRYVHFGDADMLRNSILSREMYICIEIYEKFAS